MAWPQAHFRSLGTLAMVDSSNRTLVCSVLFFDIVEYTKKAVSEQLQLKQEFNRLLGAALEQVAPRDRVILDTGDGAAVTFLGSPDDALFVALAVRDNIGTLPVRMGINLGPVRLVKDLNAQVNILGDGINVAQRVMSFAEPGQLLVSRSFFEVVSTLTSDYATLFRNEGSRTDKHVRAHEVYSVAEGMNAARLRMKTESRLEAQRRAGFPSPEPRSFGGYVVHDPGDNRTQEPAQVYDAGPNIIVSGYTRSSVEEALKTLGESGSRAPSSITQVGDKWVATCEHPTAGLSACKVEDLGFTRIVTGPTREAVSAKVEELVGLGCALVSEIEFAGGVWTAVCDTGESRRQ